MAARLAIFDFDGTLADTWPWFVDVLDAAAVRFRFRRVGAAELERLRGCTTREIVRALEVPWWKLPSVVAYGRRRAAADIDRITLFPGAARMLTEAAAAGVTLAIVSSNTEPTIRRVLGAELAARISIYQCGASMFGKPAKLRKTLRLGRHAPANAIAIGDEVRDIEAAHAVGMASGAVLWGYARGEALRRAGATHVFETFDALRAHLVG